MDFLKKKSSRNLGEMESKFDSCIFVQNELVETTKTSYKSCGVQLKSLGLTGVKNPYL